MDHANGNFLMTAPDVSRFIFDYTFTNNSTHYFIGQDGKCEDLPPNSAPSVVAVPSTAVWNATGIVDGELCDIYVDWKQLQQSKFSVSQSRGYLVSIEQFEHAGRYTVNHFSDYSMAPVPITLPVTCTNTNTAPAFPAAQAQAQNPAPPLSCDGAGNCCGPWDTICCASSACPHTERHTGGTCC
jgi:hypothetical protein